MGSYGLHAGSALTRSMRALGLAAALVLPCALHAQSDPSSTGSEPFVEVTVLDVGQADAIIIREPGGAVAMVDAGGGETLRFLQRMRVDSLALLVGTEGHPAHSGGLVDVLTARPVATLVHGASDEPGTERLLASAQRLSGVSVIEAGSEPIELPFGEASVHVLPTRDSLGAVSLPVGVVVEFGDFRAFLPGDATSDELGFWVDSGLVPDVTVLKAPGHGRIDGVNRPFLSLANPEVVVVSVGSDNVLGLPRPEAMTAFESAAATVYRTDVGGHVTVFGYADGSYEVARPTNLSAIEPEGVPSPASAGPRPLERGTIAPFSLLSVDVESGGDSARPWDLNSEYVTVGNHGPADVVIGGWTVCDLSTRCFRFPPGATIRAGSTVRVHSGYGHTDGYSFFMNETRAVWNDNGDQATLSDASGVVRGRHVY